MVLINGVETIHFFLVFTVSETHLHSRTSMDFIIVGELYCRWKTHFHLCRRFQTAAVSCIMQEQTHLHKPMETFALPDYILYMYIVSANPLLSDALNSGICSTLHLQNLRLSIQHEQGRRDEQR